MAIKLTCKRNLNASPSISNRFFCNTHRTNPFPSFLPSLWPRTCAHIPQLGIHELIRRHGQQSTQHLVLHSRNVIQPTLFQIHQCFHQHYRLFPTFQFFHRVILVGSIRLTVNNSPASRDPDDHPLRQVPVQTSPLWKERANLSAMSIPSSPEPHRWALPLLGQ